MIRIRFYDADHGGMRDELTKEEYTHATMEAARAYGVAQRSAWGFNYEEAPAGKRPRHGQFVVAEVADEVPDVIAEIEALKARYKELTDEEYGH